jgi:hypothetical protein
MHGRNAGLGGLVTSSLRSIAGASQQASIESRLTYERPTRSVTPWLGCQLAIEAVETRVTSIVEFLANAVFRTN